MYLGIRKFVAMTSVVLALLYSVGLAEPVRIEQAGTVADTFLKVQDIRQQKELKLLSTRGVSKEPAGRLAIAGVTEICNNDGKVLAYVTKLEPKGFIATSTDTDINPIIAYSFNSDFPIEDVNNVLSRMLKRDMELRLKAVSEYSESEKAKNNSLWHSYITDNLNFKDQAFQQWPEEGTTSTGGWVETAWHQGEPYNQFCPIDPQTGWRSKTGCTATAMAQIVNYHKYIGDLSFSYDDAYLSNNIQIDLDSAIYDFPSFEQLNTYLSDLRYKYQNGIPLDNNDFATLNFACGVSTETQYYSSSSSSNFINVESALLNKFDYTAVRKMAQEWDFYGTLKSNMMNAQPSEVGIHSKDLAVGWHSVVCDGYNTEGYYHLNFGWGPSSPNDVVVAWYFLPEGMPAGYNMIEDGVVNIKPVIPELNINPMNLYFGVENIGNSSDPKTFVLSNEGDSIVTINSINAPTGFEIKRSSGNYSSSISSFDILPGYSETLYVIFSPADAIQYDDFIVINHENLARNTSYIPVNGTGINNGTIIPGGQVSGIWSESNSPYYINGDISINQDNTLIVEPGVKILFAGHFKLEVERSACLIAEGTEDKRIEFTALDNQIGWHGIRFSQNTNESIVKYCIFSYSKKSDEYNNPDFLGSAIYAENTNVLIANNQFIHNSCAFGAGSGAICFSNAPKNTIIGYNEFLYDKGGGIHILDSPNVNIFSNWICANDGVGITAQHSNLIIANNIIANNSGGACAAGGIQSYDSVLTVTNNTIVNNDIAGICSCVGSQVFVNSSIIYGNKDSITQEAKEIIDVSYSDIEGGYAGIGNIDEEPQFVNPTINMGPASYFDEVDFHLNNDSNCIDTGNPSAFYIDSDLTRNDIGAYGGSGLIPNFDRYDFGSLGIRAYGNCTNHKEITWTLSNFRGESFTIDDASLSSFDFDIIDSNFPLEITPNSSIEIKVRFSPHGIGDISDTMIVTSNDLYGPNTVEILFDGYGIDATSLSGEIEGTLRLVDSPFIALNELTVPRRARLEIEPGVILKFLYSTSIHFNGQIYAIGTPDSVIVFTSYDKGWEGIDFDGSGILKYCKIENSVTDGIMCSNSADKTISNCLITNSGSVGIAFHRIGGTIINNIISNNEGSGILCIDGGSPNIVNNTIVKNGFYGMQIGPGALPTLKNNIIWGNENGFEIWGDNNPLISFCCIDGYFPSHATDEGGNIYEDPQFVDFENGDFHLTQTSPCIDAGDPNYLLNDDVDIDGDSRIIGARIDIGADEYSY